FFNKLLESNPPLRKQKISKTETKLITQEGTELFISINIHLLRDARGKTIGKIIVIQDITRLKKLEEQAERRNRLMAMGELAVNIAHEIRNPLGSIELFASLLKRELKDNPDNLKLVEHIISSIKSLNHTLSNLLLFTKTQKPAFTDIDIHEFLDNAASFINYNLKQNNICLKRIYGSKNPIIKGDGELLKQVFFNLTLNAIQAMPEGGTLNISTKVLDGKFNRKENNEKNINGKNMNGLNLVEIKFVDSGNGIPEGYIKSIFTPFFTTKERGTGLGLAIVHNIIDSHNGFISAKSIKGKGTEFSISIPIERFRQAKTERILNNSKILGLEKQL
ncbi:MAG TPA: ATP-binding protein, partial [Nitrospinota bacterium]|nr:ATP-binding protein [Nitrospinota bacterium]